MKDIAKMKAKFEQELKYAELENQFNEILEPEGLELTIVGDSFTQKGMLSAYITEKGGGLFHNSPLAAGKALSLLPSDGVILMYTKSGEDKVPVHYEATVEKSVRDSLTQCEIGWTHKGIDIDIKFDIDYNACPELKGFFKTNHRNLKEHEITFQKTAYNYDFRHNFPYEDWCSGNVVHYEGGRSKQTSEGIVTSLVETLKYLYEYKSE